MAESGLSQWGRRPVAHDMLKRLRLDRPHQLSMPMVTDDMLTVKVMAKMIALHSYSGDILQGAGAPKMLALRGLAGCVFGSRPLATRAAPFCGRAGPAPWGGRGMSSIRSYVGTRLWGIGHRPQACLIGEVTCDKRHS